MAVMKRTLPVRRSPKLPASGVKAVLIMGIDKCIKEAQNHNAILETLLENTGDLVVEQMVSLCQYRSMSPERKMFKSLGHSL